MTLGLGRDMLGLWLDIQKHVVQGRVRQVEPRAAAWPGVVVRLGGAVRVVGREGTVRAERGVGWGDWWMGLLGVAVRG